jgi:hypothetical protein
MEEILISVSLNHNEYISEEYLGHITVSKYLLDSRLLLPTKIYWIDDVTMSVPQCKSKYIFDIEIIDEERGVSSEDDLTICLLGEDLEDLSQMTLVLRMEMEFWLINEYDSSDTVARDDIFDHGDDGFFS